MPMLDQARLLRIRGNGLLIGGVEVIPLSRGSKNIKTARYQQTWWCVPVESTSPVEPRRPGEERRVTPALDR